MLTDDRCSNCGVNLEAASERCPSCGADVRVRVNAPAYDEPPRRWKVSPGQRAGIAVLLMAGAVGIVWLLGKGRAAPTAELRSPAPVTELAPLALGGGSFLCPSGYQYAAYERPHQFYPPNHPSHPGLAVRPVKCFATAENALADGYVLPPPPAGAELVNGVYLVPVDLARKCRAAARQLGFAVPCPTSLPNAPAGADGPNCGAQFFTQGQGCAGDGTFYLDFRGFAIPPHYQEPEPLSVSVVLVAFDRRVAHDSNLYYFLACPGAPWSGLYEVPLDGGVTAVTAEVRQCPAELPPPLAEHTILRWMLNGITYEVAVSRGEGGAGEGIALAIASRLRLTG